MGARATQTLTEIDELRSSLEATLTELGIRLPPAVRATRRALGGVVGGVLLFALARLRSRARKAPHAKAPSGVIVRSTGISAPAAIGVAAIWAAVRVWERTDEVRARRPSPVAELRRERGA